VGTEYIALFVRNNTTVGRLRLSGGPQTLMGSYTDLADTRSITVVPSRNRGCFRNVGASEMEPIGVETSGCYPAVFSSTP
jgi:hypothetical protein